jgi:hypothetical protein
MSRDDMSYLQNRVDELPPHGTGQLFTFHYNDTGEEFGVGTKEEYDALKALGYVDPDSFLKAA